MPALAYTAAEVDQAITDALAALPPPPVPTPPPATTVANTPGGVALDSFAGASDDDKLTAALNYAAQQTVKPHLFFANRRYDFAQPNRVVFSGLKLSGLGGHGDQQRSANSIPNDIRFSGSGSWFTMPASGSVFDLFVGGLSLQGNANAVFLAGTSAVLWTSVIRDVAFNLWRNVLGSPATKLLLTACLFDGWWNTNNSYNTAFTLGGSDNNLWTDGCLLDSPPQFTTGYGANPHLWLSWMSKTTVGPMYITGDKVSSLRIDGGSGAQGGLVLCGNGRAEGRNTNTPTTGANITITGGGVTVRDWSVNFGLAGPGGVIVVNGGEVLLDGLWYDRAAGIAETVPFILQNGGNLVVRNLRRGFGGGAWTGYPVVKKVGGTLHTDDTVARVG